MKPFFITVPITFNGIDVDVRGRYSPKWDAESPAEFKVYSVRKQNRELVMITPDEDVEIQIQCLKSLQEKFND